MKRKIVIATIKSWNVENALKFKEKNKNKYDVRIISKKEGLTYEKINKYKPEYIFFPHWSWIIPEKIYNNFECFAFHMTDLPFGRGGSPLQNLILRGYRKTRISVFRVIKELDAGPIYMKQTFSLQGSARDIYRRASRIIFQNMIPRIVKNKPALKPQKGKVIIFKRRSPGESKIPREIDLNGMYNYIRMLDAEGYPLAYTETPKLKFEFYNAYIDKKCISANVKITEKNNEK
ncbi:MAG: formyltransferase family protein [Candidatus Omnitrophota bacterium]|jgi:methionyl-tRNA formyltransferase